MNSDTVIAYTKKGVKFVVCAGTSKIVASIIANNTSPDKLTDKVAILAASFVIGSMVAEAASKKTDALIDELVTACKGAADTAKAMSA